MKVFKSVKTCTISYRDDNGRSTDFVLYPDDLFFIKENVGYVRIQTGSYSWDKYEPFDMLDKIYHNKMIDIDGNKEWTWLENLNLVSPIVDGKFNIRDWEEFCKDTLVDVSLSWNRDKKLKEILVN
jgi:hypothetical protein